MRTNVGYLLCVLLLSLVCFFSYTRFSNASYDIVQELEEGAFLLFALDEADCNLYKTPTILTLMRRSIIYSYYIENPEAYKEHLTGTYFTGKQVLDHFIESLLPYWKEYKTQKASSCSYLQTQADIYISKMQVSHKHMKRTLDTKVIDNPPY